MLDIFVFKHESNGTTKLAWKPYVKPTARHVVLSTSSSHSVSCHRAWPVAEICRMFSRSCFSHHFEEARRAKLDRFEWFFLASESVDLAARWVPKVIPCTFRAEPVVGPKIVRLVLPFTTKWQGLARTLRSLELQWSSELQKHGFVVHVGVTFKRGSAPLHCLVKHEISPSLHVFRSLGIGGR